MNNRKLISFLIMLVFIGIFHTEAYADYVDYYLSMDCKPKKNIVRITPAETASEPADRSDKECRFSNGRLVKAKIGVGPAYPYGAGGADPERWLSIWIDKKKVISRFTYGTTDFYFEIYSNGYKLCQRNSKNKYICKFTPNEKFPKTRDAMEYPLPNEKHRPPANSIVTLFAKDEEFCKSFQRPVEPTSRNSELSYVIPPNGAEILDSYSFDSIQEFSLDMNNDGKDENIVGMYSRHHYRDGDIYFVFSDNPVPKPKREEIDTDSETIYAKAANRILPHYWANNSDKWEKVLANHDAVENGEYKVKNVEAPWWDTKDVPIFRFRYWYLEPFRYNQVTYFLTASREADNMHWYTVLRPEPDYSVTEMCVFQRVREYY